MRLAARVSSVIFGFLLCISISLPAFAQVDVGGLTGTVKDSTGGLISNAPVTLTNESTGIAQSTLSSSTGVYAFNAVKPGIYSLKVSTEGFETSINQGVAIHIQQKQNIDVTLALGKAIQVVAVTAAAPLLQSQDAELGQTITGAEVNNLPLEGRDWTSLAQLAPGVTTEPGGTTQSGTKAGYIVQGLSDTENDVRLDGVDDNQEMFDVGANILPPPDAIEEFKQQNGNMSAQFGHSVGSIVNAAIKSGTNSLHGDLWEYVRNNIFNAKDYFAASRPAYHQNVFGGTVGGPVYIPKLYNGQNKTFFFFDYQGSRINTPNNETSTVPTLNTRNSGFTNFQDYFNLTAGAPSNSDALGRSFPVATVFDPATTRTIAANTVDPVSGFLNSSNAGIAVRDPFYAGGSVAGIKDFSGLQSQLNILPTGRLDPNAVNLLNLYPAPTNNSLSTFNNYVSFPGSQNNINQYDIRVDEQLGQKDILFAVWDWSHTHTTNPNRLPGLANGQNYGTGTETEPRYAAVLGYTHIFSPTLSNEFHGTYSTDVRSIASNEAYTTGIPEQFGIVGVPQVAGNGGLPDINPGVSGGTGSLAGIGVSGYTPTLLSKRVVEFLDDLTKVQGSHSFTMGGQLTNIVAPITQPPYSRGNFTFSGQFSDIPNAGQGYTSMADMLLIPQAATVPNGIDNIGGLSSFNVTNFTVTKQERKYIGAYFQDDWKIRSNLTLNLGLRWDHYEPYFETHDNQANFVQSDGGDGPTGTIYIPNRTCNSVERSPSFNALLAGYNINVACSSNRSLVNAEYKNFAPRLGFAYSVSPRLVVRAGYGITYGGLGTINYGYGLGEGYPFSYGMTINARTSQIPALVPGTATTAVLENALSTTNIQLPAEVAGQGLSINGAQQNAQTPYVQTYNLTIQQQFTLNDSIQAAYVGNVGRHLTSFMPNNAVSAIAPPSTNEYATGVQGGIPFPLLQSGEFETSRASSNYNALQLVYSHQLKAGLTANLNYTFAKCFTDSATIGNPGVTYRAPWLPGFGPAADYNVCNSDVRHVVHASGLFKLPVGRGARFAGGVNKVTDLVIGGWAVNYIFTYQSGIPFTVGCLQATTAAFGCNANKVAGQSLYAKNKGVKQWLNPAAFSQPPTATVVGQSDYSPLGGKGLQARAPGLQNLDLSLFKEFPIKDQWRVQFRAEAFNVGNWVSFAVPTNLAFNNPNNFSSITSDTEGPRVIQLALKLFY